MRREVAPHDLRAGLVDRRRPGPTGPQHGSAPGLLGLQRHARAQRGEAERAIGEVVGAAHGAVVQPGTWQPAAQRPAHVALRACAVGKQGAHRDRDLLDRIRRGAAAGMQALAELPEARVGVRVVHQRERLREEPEVRRAVQVPRAAHAPEEHHAPPVDGVDARAESASAADRVAVSCSPRPRTPSAPASPTRPCRAARNPSACARVTRTVTAIGGTASPRAHNARPWPVSWRVRPATRRCRRRRGPGRASRASTAGTTCWSRGSSTRPTLLPTSQAARARVRGRAAHPCTRARAVARGFARWWWRSSSSS